MPNGIVSGDFNGDGLPDVATANFNGSDISVLLNNGNGAQAAASRLVVAAPATVTAGQGFTFTVTAKDASGNTVPGYTGTVHFSSSDPQAALPADYTFTSA